MITFAIFWLNVDNFVGLSDAENEGDALDKFYKRYESGLDKKENYFAYEPNRHAKDDE